MNSYPNQPFINDNQYVNNQGNMGYGDNSYNGNPYLPVTNVPDTSNKVPTNQRYFEYAQEVNQLKNKQSSMHCQAFFATFILIAGTATSLILYFTQSVNLSQGAMFGIIGGSYALYLIVGFCCNPLIQYLSHIDHGQNFQNYYNLVRAMIGRFRFHAECYHYETRHHTRHVTDSNGNSKTQHYTTQQKVITHSATQYLTPLNTKDVSGNVDRIRAETNMVFIHFFIKYNFVDANSSNRFEIHYSNFKMRHTRDVHQDFGMAYEVPGFVERKAFYVGQLSCSYGMWMFLFGIVGLLWPYSLWVQSKISRFSVESMKILTI